jgi:hypothetical protein
MSDINKLFFSIVAGTSEGEIIDAIDEAKSDYVDDWEDEFDNIHEAYDEQGRGEAEDHVVSDAISNVIIEGLSDEDHCRLHDMLMAHWNL